MIEKLRLSISGYRSSDELKKDEYLSTEIPSTVLQQLLDNYSATPESELFRVELLDANSNEIEEIIIPEGLTVISGPSNSGKSVIARYFKEKTGADYVRFHEPEFPSLITPNSIIETIEDFLKGDKKIMVIDSFRFFAYNADKQAAAMTGGISASLFTEFTNLSLLSMAVHKSIIVVMNFLSESDRNVETINNALIGATSGVASTTTYALTNSTTGKNPIIGLKWIARTEQNKRVYQDLVVPAKFIRDIFNIKEEVEKTKIEIPKESDSNEINMDRRKDDEFDRELTTTIRKLLK